MQDFPMRPREMIASPWRNRYLIKKSIQREVIGRYRGSALGILWSFFNPLFMLTIYTFVFSVAFKARWEGGSGSKTEFALILYSGLLVFNLFSECFNRSPGLILGNVQFVKKVVFPLEILPIITLGSALFHTCINFSVWLIAYFVLFGVPHTTIFLFPLVVFPLLLFILGISWWLASIGVYLRDISQLTGILTTATLFLSPTFYSADRLPPNIRIILHFNPLTGVIEQTRNVLLWGKFPDLTVLTIQYFCAVIICYLGFAWFQKTRKGFADVL